MKHFFLWSFVGCLLFSSSTALAEIKTLFEGYYRVLSNNEHVGYYIQRYQLDSKKKQFISTSLLQTNEKGGGMMESLNAYATDKLAPVNYQYTSIQGKTSKVIDANVRKNKKGQPVLQTKIVENGKPRVTEKTLNPNSFFSTFLIYLLLQGDKGIQAGTKYDFRAVAEEDGQEYPGFVFIEGEETRKGIPAYKVLNTFKRTQFVNFIDSQGESLESISPAFGIAAELVAQPSIATAGMPYSEKTITRIFGEIPKGTKNRKSQSKAARPSDAKGPNTSKLRAPSKKAANQVPSTNRNKVPGTSKPGTRPEKELGSSKDKAQ